MNWLPHLHEKETATLTAHQTNGQVIRWPILYELIVWVASKGREQAFRRFTAEIAGLQPGEAVLDVGCGTGTMALVAKEYVGTTGQVSGIEPSVEMVAYARCKVARHKASIDINPGVIEQLDYPARSFDAILCIIVMHHMPDETKLKGIKEMARVLKPGGRLLVIDSNLQLLPSFEQEGFTHVQTGEVPFFGDYRFVLWKIDQAKTPE